MCLERQTGFGIIAAIFLLVVLTLLAAFIASVTGMQQSSGQLDVLGVRAYQSARAGMEWGAWQVLDPNNNLPGVGGTAILPPCPAACTNLTGLGGSLSSFTVTVTCDATINAPTTEGNRNIGAYKIIATACNQPVVGPDRKSTRLNSSHLVISYAVFCLKKKNKIRKFFYYIYKKKKKIKRNT